MNSEVDDFSSVKPIPGDLPRINSPDEFEKLMRSILVNKANAEDRREMATTLVISMLSDLCYERGAALADEMIRAERET